MDITEKFKNVSIAISSIVIPIFVMLVGNQYTNSISEREVHGKFVELGVRILEEEPSDHTQNLRNWAIQILNKHSGIPIDEATRKELLDSTLALPDPGVSSIIELSPGQKFRFASLDFSLDICKGKSTIRCTLNIHPIAKSHAFTIKPLSLPAYITGVSFINNEDKVFSYRHGPQFKKVISLQAEENNEISVIFNSLSQGKPAYFLFEIDVDGHRLKIKIVP